MFLIAVTTNLFKRLDLSIYYLESEVKNIGKIW